MAAIEPNNKQLPLPFPDEIHETRPDSVPPSLDLQGRCITCGCNWHRCGDCGLWWYGSHVCEPLPRARSYYDLTWPGKL